MAVCEFLHCTKSELEQRLRHGNGYADYFLILAYMNEKSVREHDEVERAKMKR